MPMFLLQFALDAAAAPPATPCSLELSQRIVEDAMRVEIGLLQGAQDQAVLHAVAARDGIRCLRPGMQRSPMRGRVYRNIGIGLHLAGEVDAARWFQLALHADPSLKEQNDGLSALPDDHPALVRWRQTQPSSEPPSPPPFESWPQPTRRDWRRYRRAHGLPKIHPR